MKISHKTLLSATLFAVASILSAAAQQVPVGKPAPDFTLTDVTGKTHTLSDYRGKTVVLEWVNPECPFVIKHYQKSGNIPALQKAATGEGIVWLTINSGQPGFQGDFNPQQVNAWMKETKAAPTAYFRDSDSAVGRLYGAKATPHLFVITADGTVAYNGAIDSIRSARVEDISKAENYLTSALNAVKAGRAVATPVSEPYGCAIKY